jgi:intraflagellar transport protein 140
LRCSYGGFGWVCFEVEELLRLMRGRLLMCCDDGCQAGEYYESQGVFDKAVTLFHKGGRVARALELCFKYRLFGQLATITEDLDQDADPALLQRVAKFFNENNQKVRVELFVRCLRWL